MSRISNFMLGLLLGGLVGSAAALLLTPVSGEGMRGQLSGYINNLQEEVKKAAEAKRVELENQLIVLRNPKDNPPA